MLIFSLFLIPLFIVAFLWYAKIHIDWNSILRNTLPLDRGLFGVYCFTGKQGSGKTYSLVKYIKKHVKEGQVIYSNVTLAGVHYEPIRSVAHLLSLKDEKRVFIVYDEIFTLMQKSSKIDGPLMEFLTQQRKMKNILFTTAQEWLEVPVTFRRFVRIQVECTTRPLGRFGGILSEEYFDAYAMKWDNMENEYIAPRISKKYSKYEKRYMESYDTYERIRILNAKDDTPSDTAGGQLLRKNKTTTPTHPDPKNITTPNKPPTTPITTSPPTPYIQLPRPTKHINITHITTKTPTPTINHQPLQTPQTTKKLSFTIKPTSPKPL